MTEPLVETIIEDLLRDGFSVQDLALFEAPSTGDFWRSLADLRPGPEDHGRAQVGVWHPFEDLPDLTASPGTASMSDAVVPEAQRLTSALSGLLGAVAGRMAQLGILPAGIDADAAWFANITRWDPSDQERVPAHVDWELLTAVLSPDGCLTAGADLVPEGPVAVLVVGGLGTRFSGGRLKGGWHGVTGGRMRRSFQLFYLGNQSACHEHGRSSCDCGPTVAQVFEQRYAQQPDVGLPWVEAARRERDGKTDQVLSRY